MTNLLIILLTAIILMLTAYVFVLRNKVRQTSRTLKELIKENDGQQSNPGKTNGDIYFKVDKNFEITFINDSIGTSPTRTIAGLHAMKKKPILIAGGYDKGIPFDPLQKPDPDITLSAEDREIGGLGIFITKKTMDSVSYAYENGENILTMTKKL